MLLSGQVNLDLLFLHQVECGPLLPVYGFPAQFPIKHLVKRTFVLLFMTSAEPDRLQVSLDLLLLEIQFAFDLPQHLVVDTSLVAQLNDCGSLGCEHLLA